jgi:hypothetical protein
MPTCLHRTLAACGVITGSYEKEPMIYLDHAATTPVRPEVRAAMEPFLSGGSGTHRASTPPGRAARARWRTRGSGSPAALGAERSRSCSRAAGRRRTTWRCSAGGARHGRGVAVSAVEHSAVREAAAQAAREGAALSTWRWTPRGVVDLDALEEALEVDLGRVSVMWGNNEVGTVQPVAGSASCAGPGCGVPYGRGPGGGPRAGDVARTRAAICWPSAPTSSAVPRAWERCTCAGAPTGAAGARRWPGRRAPGGHVQRGGAVGLADGAGAGHGRDWRVESERLERLRDRLQAGSRTRGRASGQRATGRSAPPHPDRWGSTGRIPTCCSRPWTFRACRVVRLRVPHRGTAPSPVLVAMGAATTPSSASPWAGPRTRPRWAATAIFADVVERARRAGVRA